MDQRFVKFNKWNVFITEKVQMWFEHVLLEALEPVDPPGTVNEPSYC